MIRIAISFLVGMFTGALIVSLFFSVCLNTLLVDKPVEKKVYKETSKYYFCPKCNRPLMVDVWRWKEDAPEKPYSCEECNERYTELEVGKYQWIR